MTELLKFLLDIESQLVFCRHAQQRPVMEIPDDEMVPLIKQQYLPKDFVIGRTLSVRMPTSMTGGLVETVRLITLTGELIVRLREAEGGIS